MRISTGSFWTRLLRGILLLLPLLLAWGCGGGSHVGKKTGKGTAVFTIKWPALRKSTRLIPAAANLIRIQIVPNMDGTGTPYAAQDTVRPVTGPLLTTLVFNNLPPGQFYAVATAYPETAPPLSIAQANAVVPLNISDGQTTTTSLTMGSTITQVLPASILPNSSRTTGRLSPFTFTPLARDSADRIVLIAAPMQVTVSDSSIGSVTVVGSTFTVRNAGNLGPVTVTVTEPESGVTQSFSLTFTPAIYIADGGNHRIVRMDDMIGTNFLAFGMSGNGSGQFSVPRQLVVDSQNRIYVADNNNNRITRIDDISGAGFTTFPALGSGNAPLNNPYAVAVDALGYIYIGDTSSSRVVRIDDITGSNFQPFGISGSGMGQFHDPVEIAFDSRNRVYIADYFNHRIVRMDDIIGTNFISFGTMGSGTGQFNRPFGVAVDAQDRIYIGDSMNNRIVRMDDMNGAGFISYNAAATGTPFNSPFGIAFDPQNRIYIADYGNGRIARIDDMVGTGFIAFGAGQFSFPYAIAVR